MKQGEGEAALSKVLDAAWELARSIEPARGQVSAAQVLELRTALEQVTAERAKQGPDQPGDDPDVPDADVPDVDVIEQRDGAMATVHARAAAVAIAAGDEANAERWLAAAVELSRDDDQRAELEAARGAVPPGEPPAGPAMPSGAPTSRLDSSHERYRQLVHGRNLMARDREAAARKLWKLLAGGVPDAISRAAAAELKAPRPLRPHDSVPTLSRVNGIGAGFYGHRDRWQDGSYATTHCISVLWIPVFPLTAWRVRDAGGGYQVLAREQLSSFARVTRWAMPAAIALAIACYAIFAHVTDPERLACQRWDDALAFARDGDPEPALHRLDDELAHDLPNVDGGRAERAGAEIVRLTASYVERPFTADRLDQALRVVHRYQGLPRRAQGGVAQEAVLAVLDGWTQQLGESIAAAEPRLALLGAASQIADADRRHQLDAQIAGIRIALAMAKQSDWPLEALAILVDPAGRITGDAAVAAADHVVERLFDAPSLLIDAGADLDAWFAATRVAVLRDKATDLRDFARTGRAAAEAESTTPEQLAEMQIWRPRDQYVALQLARNDASTGDLAGAAARISALGAPGLTIRDGRLLLAQVMAAQGKLADADALLGSLLGSRLQRFAAASIALRDTTKLVQDRIRHALEAGDVPLDLRRKYETANERDRKDLISTWFEDQMTSDAALSAARAKYVALGDIVPVALAAGSVKLRRAQAMAGPPRNAMLEDAERMFLAIRTDAEGQPAFRMGLGEIYARLGKTTESDAEFAAVLARNDPELSLKVANVYRDLGSVARAKQIANQVFASAGAPIKGSAASLLGVMSDDEDEAEGWYRKADQNDPYVRASLLEVEGKRLRRDGKTAECAAKFAATAKALLALAGARNNAGYNNRRLAEAQRKRDPSIAAAVVERARHAKAIDTSKLIRARTRWLSGADDAKRLASLETDRARLEAALVRPGLEPRTRAAGLYLMARALVSLGVYKPDAAALDQARTAAAKATQLWPALDTNALIAGALVDEAGLNGDTTTWGAARRLRDAKSALDKLAADHAPLAAKILASKQWLEVAGYTRASTRRPDLGDLRIARLLGDPELVTRATAALDDKLAHLGLELAVVLDPDNAVAKEDLAYLDKR